MKKTILLLLLLGLMGITEVKAQCTPVPFPPPPLTNPDTSQGIPPAYGGVPYNEVIHVRVPSDTIVFGTLLPIDSIGVDSITGLPPSFSWATNTPSNYWIGGTYGCFNVTGNPTVADTGTYTMVLHAKIFVGHNPNNTVLYDANFDFQILDSTLMAIPGVSSLQFSVLPNAPNPFDDKTTIRFISPQNDELLFEVYNVAGSLVWKQKVQARKGINELEFYKGRLAPGVYIYHLHNEVSGVRNQMIIR